ncbi:hypothetical protein BKA70DRAFT_1421868 [Coprinopsis sp. MPI-PUGE-AT-0042]|nr:hypothetical protein BKA70DRAFT_1421868 [Coprinopsis sp. MPI-PUGE-AT-0042]
MSSSLTFNHHREVFSVLAIPTFTVFRLENLQGHLDSGSFGHMAAQSASLAPGTTRDGRDGTIPFVYDPDHADREQYRRLPNAKTVLVTFPVTSGAKDMVDTYLSTRSSECEEAQFIQLGTTSIWDGHRKPKGAAPEPPKVHENKWYDRSSPFNPTPRSDQEDALLSLSPRHKTTVLHLAGLWGGARTPKNWTGKVAPTKEALRLKASLHLLHGVDLARAILAVHFNFDKASGQRWMLTDGRIYDWWNLASSWGAPNPPDNKDVKDEDGDRGPYARWVRELMQESGIRALPRSAETLGRALDSQEFWRTFSLSPVQTLLSSL